MSKPRQTVVPYLCVNQGANALEFYPKAFGAEITSKYLDKDGRVGHAEMTVAGAMISFSDEYPELGVFSPAKFGGSPVGIQLVVADIDGFVKRAAEAGAIVERAPADQPYGDRSAYLRDPFGHRWYLAQPIEDVSKEEIQRRMGDSFLID
jgi:PhnB protein